MGIMADAGSRPEVVHRPHDRLSRTQDFTDVLQREHALVDPGEMYDVGLLELAQLRDVAAGVGEVYLKKVVAGEMQVPEHAEPFPEEVPLVLPLVAETDHGDVVRQLVTHQHLRLHAVVVQRILEPVGGNSRPACLLTGIYYQYSHWRIICSKVTRKAINRQEK